MTSYTSINTPAIEYFHSHNLKSESSMKGQRKLEDAHVALRIKIHAMS
jgi:hypothetical protein